MSPERPAILASVQGDYGGGRVESEQGGIVLRTGRLSLLPLTGLMKPGMPVHRGMPRTLCVTLAPPSRSGRSTASGRGQSGTSVTTALGCAELRFAGEGIEGIAEDGVEAGWWVTEERRNEGIATEAMEAAIDDLLSRTDVETITAYISDWGTKHPAAWQPGSDSRYAAEATGARASR